MQIGQRIIYDNQTGEIVDTLPEQSGDNVIARPTWNGITYIDIPYGQDADKFARATKLHVDVTNKIVVFDELAPVPVDSTYLQKSMHQTVFSLAQSIQALQTETTTVKNFVSMLKGI